MAGIRYRTGVVFAMVVFILGVTAAVATGWENAGGTEEKVTHERGKARTSGKDDNDRSKSGRRDKDEGDRDKEKGKGKEDRDKDDGTRTTGTRTSRP